MCAVHVAVWLQEQQETISLVGLNFESQLQLQKEELSQTVLRAFGELRAAALEHDSRLLHFNH